MSLITIDQLLESVDLDFEPRFVTKDLDGSVAIWNEKPYRSDDYWTGDGQISECADYNRLKIAEFENKHWTECIYEVPRKTTGKIERFVPSDFDTVRDTNEYVREVLSSRAFTKLNALVDMVNNIISVQEKMIDSRFVVDAVNELKGAKNETH